MNLLLANITPQTVDIVAIVFVLIFAISGLIKGFTKLFFKAVGTIVSLLLAFLLCASVADFLESQFSLVTSLGGKLEGILSKAFGAELMNTTLEQAINNGIGDLPIGELLMPIIKSFAEDSSIPTTVTLNQIICPTFAYYLVMILSAIVLFIIFKIVFWIIYKVVSSLQKIGAVALADKLLGLALGFICGAVYLELAIMVMGVLPFGFIQDICAVFAETTFVALVQKIGLFGIILNFISSNDIIGFVKGIVTK